MMNNLTQTQTDAKQAYLDRQAKQMLAVYQNADTNERNAVIRQIDSFLEIVPRDAKIFWLNFRCKLERINEHSLPPVV
jgi:HPt (histidine-containing phosphotransfer) domain-containing protein